MGARVLALLRARLSGDGRAGNLPVALPALHAVVAGVLAWLARDALLIFGYGVYTLTVTAVLVAVPLLGEFGYLLRADEAEEWVASLPVTRRDLRLARALHVLTVIAWVALGSIVPAVLLAPVGSGAGARALLALGAVGLATSISAALLVVHAALRERAEALVVLLQTLLVIGAVAGFVLGRQAFPALAALERFGEATWTWLWPPAWFAAPLGGGPWWTRFFPLVACAAALAVLAMVAPPPEQRARGEPLASRLLKPLRALATRAWVRRDERAVFDLVYDALPREREVILRTYPMVGIPLAFLVAARAGGGGAGREDLLAVLLFTACVYVPVLLVHLPASESHGASWILATRPPPEGALRGGAIKAVAVRFLVPLYALLALLAWIESGPSLVLRLALPGFLLSLLVTRRIYPLCVHDLPLSVPPDQLRSKVDWGGAVVGWGVLLTVAAVLANRALSTPLHGALLALALLAAEAFGEWRMRRSLG